MIIFPAIDLKDNQCVRLFKGDMDQATIYNTDPVAQAKSFEDSGFPWLHIVDLNGAFAGEAYHADMVNKIIEATSLNIQLGGGIRSIDRISSWLNLGIKRVILGTIAVKDPALVKEACQKFPGQIVVGIDAKDGLVATEGWAESSSLSVIDLAKKFEDCGVSAIIYTDINKDGTLEGPDFKGTKFLAESISIPVIASGGVSNSDDLDRLDAMSSSGIEGAIVGKAIYDKKISIEKAVSFMV